MSTLVLLSARYLFGRKFRSLLTTLSVVLGVAVIYAGNTLLPAMVSAIESSLLGASGQVDLSVGSAIGETFDTDVVTQVRQTSGVAAASPALRRQIPLTGLPDASAQMEMVGVDPATTELVRRYQLTDGRFLGAGDERSAVVSQPLASVLRVKPGDTFTIPTIKGAVQLEVVGVVGTQGATQFAIPLATAQQLFAGPGRINTVDIALAAGADRDSVKRDLAARLGPQYEVGSADTTSEVLASAQIGVVGLNLFGLLVLFMGGFLIFNTFRTVVVERRRDLGMLRAVGATRRTVLALIVAESLLQGLVGTALGLAVGYLFALAMVAWLQAMLEQYLRVRLAGVPLIPAAFALATALGLGVTLLAGLIPALGASRVPVLSALRPQAASPSGHRVGRGAIAGGLLLVLSVGAMGSGNANAAGAGALLFLAAMVVLAPSLVNPIAGALGPLVRLAFRGEAPVAMGNMRRQPGRAAVTASALMIALAIIVASTGLFASLERTFLDYLDRSLAADIVLLPPSLVYATEVGVGEDFERELDAIEGVGDWASVRYASGQVNGAPVQVLGLDPDRYPRVASLSFDQGDADAFAQMKAGRAAIVTPILANAAHVKLGDSIALQTPEGPRQYQVAAVASEYLTAKIATAYISQANMAADFHRGEDEVVLANLAPDADREQVRADLQRLLAAYPQLTLFWGADYRAAQRAVLSQAFAAINLLLVVLVIPSLLGLINTLAISVLERTREIGVLRAVGATRAQVRSIVLAESLLLGSVGAAFGMLAGLALGYGLTRAVAASLAPSVSYTFPVAGLLAAVVVALAMAVVASLLPARQAANLEVVQALHYE